MPNEYTRTMHEMFSEYFQKEMREAASQFLPESSSTTVEENGTSVVVYDISSMPKPASGGSSFAKHWTVLNPGSNA